MNRDKLRALLIHHEGIELKIYKDTKGNETIGVGRNLRGQGLTEQEAMYLLENDMSRVVAYCRGTFPWFNSLDDTRQNVIASMVFNMGGERVLGFKRMLAAIAIGDFENAANEMQLSQWASDVGKRAVELAQMMRTGDVVH